MAENRQRIVENNKITDHYTCLGTPLMDRTFCFCSTREITKTIISPEQDIESTKKEYCDRFNFEILKESKTVNFIDNVTDEKFNVPLTSELTWGPVIAQFTTSKAFIKDLFEKDQVAHLKEQAIQLAGKGIKVLSSFFVNSRMKCYFKKQNGNLICERQETFNFEVERLFNNERVYADATSAGCLVKTRQGYILFQDRNGYIQLPGGKRFKGELAQEAAIRSTKEETGAIVTIKDLHSSFTPMLSNGKHYLFNCELSGENQNYIPEDQFESQSVLFFNVHTRKALLSKDWVYPSNKELLEKLTP